ncbi:hypothetical protein CEE55_22405 [Stenotrophomonas pavanii]|uniref:Uncharacterized protein n=1 Tax=Stenotrophomonas pavanii TaxID=487698 RepID=A0A246KQI8_9GAMM|nr:hypothetical protein [Stenotrophomonas pavanii]OWR25636.1 hypothetical protein CEE55_22405 [Stenotrophomonas pavanii]
MSRFFLGQRVRIVRVNKSTNLGRQGVITCMGSWEAGGTFAGHILDAGFHADVLVKWDSDVWYGNVVMSHGPAHTDNLEPILPEGSAPSEFTFQQLMDNLQEVMA